MDVFEAIRLRRSIRKYKDKEVPWDNIVTILQAGKYTPSAGNLQNWKFIAVKIDAKRTAIAKACMQQEWMENAPVYIVVIGEPKKAERFYGVRGSRLYTVQQCGAAIQTMMLTATSLGLGSCWVGAFDEYEIRRILGLPEDVNVQGIITIGHSDEQPDAPPKLRLEHLMYFDKWFGRLEYPKTYIGWWSVFNKRTVDETKKLAKKVHKKVKEKVSEKMSKN